MLEDDDSAVEYSVLTALSRQTLTEAELVQAVGAEPRRLARLLHGLVRDTYVAELPQDTREPEYQLAPAGIARLSLSNQLANNGPVGFGTFIGMTAAAHAEAEQAVVRQQQSKLLLTDQDRSLCSTALSEQVGLGRIEMAELHRRTELLYAAKTRADLEPVFLGLPRPQLHGEQIEPKRRTWRWVVFGVAAGMSVPFLLFGLIFLLAGSDAGDRGFGAFLTVGAVLWTLFAFGWARRGRSRRT